MFKHFVITRFNLKKKDWVTNKNNVEVLTDEWHYNRFRLFNDFCLSTISSQTNKNFEWLVYFDSSTKAEFRAIISDIQAKLPNFKPFFVNGMDAYLPAIQSYIKASDADYVITSRLDNDDSVSKDYIDIIQQQFIEKPFLAIDFINGYTLNTSKPYRLGKKLHQFNPFISLIEKNDNPMTVWSKTHGNWKKEKNLIQIKDHRIWCSIIHTENKVNEFTGYDAVNLEHFFKRFTFSSTTEESIRHDFQDQSHWTLLSSKNKMLSNYKYYRRKLKKQLGFYK
ncbi:glycosyltransferase [Formosa sp. 3Alg 14/1]|uniref:glycosyltransferase n=1 Tax=Formosa sp. 3Alg 14/1 TaxID=3382190 RepID=UPI0039BE4458